MNELYKWYEHVTYQEAKNILREKMDVMKKNFIAAGYYMKYIRDNELFREDGTGMRVSGSSQKTITGSGNLRHPGGWP